MTTALAATIPSPSQGVWYLGPLPVRAYAMCILAGIVVAVFITQRRLADRGGRPGQALDVAAWAVPFGIVGGRLYHVATDPELYFAAGKHPLDAFKIWNGGLGIWGAIALGAVGAWIGCRRHGVNFLDFIDSAAPGIAVAQALGRWGNYFNNELYGGKTSLPWGLEIHEWDQGAGRAVVDAQGHPVVLGVFQPTFLYESVWCLLVALTIVLLERRLGHLARGRAFALYVMLYTAGRAVIEMMRDDHANHVLGLRLNVWTALVVFLGGLYGFWRAGRAGARAGGPAGDVAGPAGDAGGRGELAGQLPDARSDHAPEHAPEHAPSRDSD